MKRSLLLLFMMFLVSACDPMSFMPDAQEKFVDQGFKTAIALVELHRIRTGEYPDSLGEIRFTGEWDPIYSQFVEYKKLDNGYELNADQQQMKEKLSYPPEFWQGLGLKSTNVKGFAGSVGSYSNSLRSSEN